MVLKYIKNFIKSVKGTVSIEYALGLIFVGITLGLGFTDVGTQLRTYMINIAKNSEN